EEASGTYGSFDIIAKMEAKDLASLVIDEIRRLDGVVDTNTLIVAL
ncbi:MAG: AsnC family transcriptional regulator, partial [Candidatus Altiarchaeales archaeon ex4484_43]